MEFVDIESNSKQDYIKNYLSGLSDDEQTRFEFYVRSKINVTLVTKIMEETVKKRSETLQISDEMAIIVSSLCKSYICEIADTSLQLSPSDNNNKKFITSEAITEALFLMENKAHKDCFEIDECS